MKKQYGPLLIIGISLTLIVLNIVFTSDEMGWGFWMRIVTSGLLIVAMVFAIRETRQRTE